MRVAPAASTRAENTQTHRHTDTQTHSRTRARAPMAQTATEGPPSFSGVNAIKQFWRVRSDFKCNGGSKYAVHVERMAYGAMRLQAAGGGIARGRCGHPKVGGLHRAAWRRCFPREYSAEQE